MSSFKKKFDIAGKPFFMILLCYMAVYSFLHWLLGLRYELIPAKEIVWRLWAPLVLVWIPVWLVLKPRLKKAGFTGKNGPAALRLSALAAVLIAICTCIAQFFTVVATGRFSRLTDIKAYANQPPTAFYTLENYFIDKDHKGVMYSTRVYGKRNRRLELNVLVAMPLWASATDSVVGKNSNYWIVCRYSKSISNRSSQEKKDALFSAFKDQAMKRFDTTGFGAVNYLERVQNPRMFDDYERAVYASSIGVTHRPVMFTIPQKSIGDRRRNGFLALSVGLFLSAAIWLLATRYTRLKEDIPPESHETNH